MTLDCFWSRWLCFLTCNGEQGSSFLTCRDALALILWERKMLWWHSFKIGRRHSPYARQCPAAWSFSAQLVFPLVCRMLKGTQCAPCACDQSSCLPKAQCCSGCWQGWFFEDTEASADVQHPRFQASRWPPLHDKALYSSGYQVTQQALVTRTSMQRSMLGPLAKSCAKQEVAEEVKGSLPGAKPDGSLICPLKSVPDLLGLSSLYGAERKVLISTAWLLRVELSSATTVSHRWLLSGNSTVPRMKSAASYTVSSGALVDAVSSIEVACDKGKLSIKRACGHSASGLQRGARPLQRYELPKGTRFPYLCFSTA